MNYSLSKILQENSILPRYKEYIWGLGTDYTSWMRQDNENSGWKQYGNSNDTFSEISAGEKEVWATKTDNTIWRKPIDGTGEWTEFNSGNLKKISNAIEKISHQKGPLLQRISMSFNKDLKDEGLIKILNVLPDSTSAIGFVECGITDIGGQKIIDWAYKNKGIKQIYLEGNFFSKHIINKFMKLKNDKPDIAMIIEWPSEEFKKMVLDNYK